MSIAQFLSPRNYFQVHTRIVNHLKSVGQANQALNRSATGVTLESSWAVKKSIQADILPSTDTIYVLMTQIHTIAIGMVLPAPFFVGVDGTAYPH